MNRNAMGLVWALALLAGCGGSSVSEKPKTQATEEKAAKAATDVVLAAAPVSPAAPAAEPEVLSWNGSRPTETKSFYAAKPEWHLKYATRRDAAQSAGAEEANFQIYVHRADSGKIVALATNTRGNAEGTVAVQTAPGLYYLRIWAAAPWTVEVQDLR